MRTARLKIALAVSAPIALLYRLLPPGVYSVDLQVDYLLGRALRDGLDLFTPLDQLASRYLPQIQAIFPHASPRPPWLVLATLPLSFLPYEWIGVVWLALSLALLLLIGRRLELSRVESLAALGFLPILETIAAGQWEIVILALAVLGWDRARRGRDVSAGALLGLAAAIKLYPAVLVAPYLFRRRPRVVVASGVVFLLSQCLNLILVGPDGLLRFFLEILPENTRIYAPDLINASPFGAFLRVFGGANHISPLVDAPWLVVPLAAVFSLTALLFLVRCRPEAAPLAILLGMPIAWTYYSALLFPLALSLWRERRRRGVLLVSISLSMLPLSHLASLLAFIGGSWFLSDAAIAILGMLQPLGWLGLLVIEAIGVPSDRVEAGLVGRPAT